MQHNEIVTNAKTWLFKASLAALVAMLLCFVVALKTRQNEMRRARLQEHHQRLQAAGRLSKEVARSISLACKAGLSETEFAELFPEMRRMSERSHPRDIGPTYYHPEIRQTFLLRFDDGKLKGFDAGPPQFGSGRRRRHEPFGFVAAETVRKWVLSLSLVVWLVALILAPFEWGQTTAVSNIAVICALIWLLASFLAPDYTVTYGGLRGNDALGLGALMLVVSLIWGYVCQSRWIGKLRVQRRKSS
jgi:hypothetical protein